ncbi:MAG: hypothetical protein ABIZ57_08865, partial [Candidatus Limnocylindria bacterium]
RVAIRRAGTPVVGACAGRLTLGWKASRRLRSSASNYEVAPELRVAAVISGHRLRHIAKNGRHRSKGRN